MTKHGETIGSTSACILKIGLPSIRSRLYGKVARLLGHDTKHQSRHLVFRSQQTAVFFVRPWDLPALVAGSKLDVAVCGLDTIMELDADVVIQERFESMRSSVALCVRKTASTSPTGRDPLVVATEYPKIAREFLSKRETPFELHRIRGAAEAYPHLDGITGIVDVVETGQTLAANDLCISDVITYTCPCLIRRRALEIEAADLRIENLSQRVAAALEGVDGVNS